MIVISTQRAVSPPGLRCTFSEGTCDVCVDNFFFCTLLLFLDTAYLFLDTISSFLVAGLTCSVCRVLPALNLR